MNAINDQLGNKIAIVPVSDVISITGNDFVLSHERNFNLIFTTNDLDFVQSPSNSDAGVMYAQSLMLNIRTRNRMPIFNSADYIVILYTLRGKQIVWGSKDFPVRPILNPILPSTSILLRANSLYPLFLE